MTSNTIFTDEQLQQLRRGTTRKEIPMMTVPEAAKVFRALGIKGDQQTIRNGLEQGKFPWGIAIEMDRCCTYEIYERLFWEWVEERMVTKPIVLEDDDEYGT